MVSGDRHTGSLIVRGLFLGNKVLIGKSVKSDAVPPL